MEHSCYQDKTKYFQNTQQHGRGFKDKRNSLYKTLNWFYYSCVMKAIKKSIDKPNYYGKFLKT